jgi:hypothetical protein
MQTYLQEQHFGFELLRCDHTRLRRLVSRYERTLLSYDSCTSDELQRFVKARKLSLPDKDSVSKDDLIQKPEDADETQTFHRFFNMPPELRNDVYTAYADWLGPIPAKSRHPPVCIVSRQPRKEFLPIFYGHGIIQVQLSTRLLTTAPRYDQTPAGCHLTSRTATALQSIDLTLFAHIKCLQFELDEAVWLVDMRVATVQALTQFPVYPQQHASWPRFFDKGTVLLEFLADTVMKREGGGELQT